jgi:signal transduction histidine kinase/ActR/RegA family two-component response regulator
MPKEKVLIVDDEPDVLDLCKRILESQGYDVSSASNGYDAIDIARDEDFDLLLTDIKMPGMTGLDIAQVLKESDPGIICVTMTGYATMDSAIKALSLGIDEFILKPFTPKDLVRGINKALEKEHLKKENFRLRSLIPLFELNKTLMGTVEVDNVLNRLIEIAQGETKANFAGLYIFKDSELVSRLNSDDSTSFNKTQQQASNQLARFIFEEGKQLTWHHGAPSQNHHGIFDQLGATSVIATPLKSQNSKLGVLILAHAENSFAQSDSEFLSVLCGQAGIALENARAYQQLQMLDHMKSEFINIAAHELRTPLSILMGYASILEEEAPDPQREFVTNIMRNAMRLRALMDDMLNLKKLETGLVSISQDSLRLQEVVEQIIQDLSLLSDEKHNYIIDIPADFPDMIIDRQKLELILVNLLHNAIKFTPPGGYITYKARMSGNQAIMSLNNTGITIPTAAQDRIFERFFQVEDSLTREHGGAGLGLSIVRGMVEVCGGKIYVESADDEGTTFTFNLPLDNTNLRPSKLKI